VKTPGIPPKRAEPEPAKRLRTGFVLATWGAGGLKTALCEPAKRLHVRKIRRCYAPGGVPRGRLGRTGRGLALALCTD
jgi:hypothetical protein